MNSMIDSDGSTTWTYNVFLDRNIFFIVNEVNGESARCLQYARKLRGRVMKVLINARVSSEVDGWIRSSAAKDRRSVSEYLFLLLEDLMKADRRKVRQSKF